MRMSSMRNNGAKEESSELTVNENLSNSEELKEGQTLGKRKPWNETDKETSIKRRYREEDPLSTYSSDGNTVVSDVNPLSKYGRSGNLPAKYSDFASPPAKYSDFGSPPAKYIDFNRSPTKYNDSSDSENNSNLSVSSISYNPQISCNSSPSLSPDEMSFQPIEDDAENLLIFKNKVKKTDEKNNFLALGMKEGSKNGSWREKDFPMDEVKKVRKRIGSNDGIKNRLVTGNENAMLNRENDMFTRNANTIACNDTSTIAVSQCGTSVDIQPISSFTNVHRSFRRISWNSSSDDSKQIDYDPLDVLRNVAKIEANNFKERAEEAYFSPPVSPKKHPLQYLKKAVSREEKNEISEAKQKSKKIMKEASFELDSEYGETDQKSINDFDESIFNYNQDTKLFYCPWEGCGKSFPSLSRIKRHYIIHTKVKPFKCLNKGCIRRFSRKDNMLQHYRVHCPFANSKNS